MSLPTPTSTIAAVSSTAQDPPPMAVRSECDGHTHQKLIKYQNQYQRLVQATRAGEPVFSWCMPHAKFSYNSQVLAFLNSPRSGPETIIVGGGIGNARSLSNCLPLSLLNPYCTPSGDPLGNGYSAKIEATNDKGRNAAVVVTKTRALFDALVQKYREDVSNLAEVAEEICKLGGALPSMPAGQTAQLSVGSSVAMSSGIATTTTEAAAQSRALDPPTMTTNGNDHKKLHEYQSQYQQLLQATQAGEPDFSWCMTHAKFPYDFEVLAFLKSPRSGPETIIVGGGIGNARSLSNCLPLSLSNLYRTPSGDPLGNGYSAKIEATNDRGRNAAVVVTKTTALYVALVEKYREDVSNMTKLAEEIRKLGGALPSMPRHTAQQTVVASVARPISSVITTTTAAAAAASTTQNPGDFYRNLRLIENLNRCQNLIQAMRAGEPANSWSMPHAKFPYNSQVLAFLRSPRSGPETIIVGGGLVNARSMSNCLPLSLDNPYCTPSDDPLGNGYSAKIEATNDEGRNAAVVVTKTRALYDALVQKYREDVSNLMKVVQEICNLFGVPPPMPAGHTV